MLFITMFMFTCFYSCARMIQSCQRDKERKTWQLLRLLLQGKGDGGLRGAPLLLVVLLLVLLLPDISYFPSCSPLPLCLDVCIVGCLMFPVTERLMVVSFCSGRPSERLPNYVRCSAVHSQQYYRESSASSAESLIVACRAVVL